jgi:protein-S-isoprenylcysteine O-methyltransferase Ste14
VKLATVHPVGAELGTVRARGRRGSALAGSCVLAAFVAIEGRLRQGDAARSFEAGEEDKGTTASVGASLGLALVAGPLLARWRRGRLCGPIGWFGVGLMVGGLSLRAGAARALGSHYTRTLRTDDDQPIVTSGPYRYVRHPGYAGVLLMWLGYGLALTSAPATLATTVPNLVSYLRRIDAEETMLADSFGDIYRSYQQRSWRLAPRLY